MQKQLLVELNGLAEKSKMVLLQLLVALSGLATRLLAVLNGLAELQKQDLTKLKMALLQQLKQYTAKC